MLETRSVVNAAPDDVWRRIGTPEGINYELAPWLQMTVPRRLRGLTLEDAPVGRRLGRSWVLLFGVLPVDYDDLCLVHVEPRRRFVESSATLGFTRWQHERCLVAVAGRTEVVDRIEFDLRWPLSLIPGVRAMARAIVRALFRHRHRRLVDYFARQSGDGSQATP